MLCYDLRPYPIPPYVLTYVRTYLLTMKVYLLRRRCGVSHYVGMERFIYYPILMGCSIDDKSHTGDEYYEQSKTKCGLLD